MTLGLQRFKRDFTCPVCGGSDDDPRGEERRCFGYISEDRRYAHCTRAEHSEVRYHPKSLTWSHRLDGPCKCGVEHRPSSLAIVPRATPGPKPAAKRAKPAGRPVEWYDYRDADGELAYQVLRYDPKGFKQRRPDGRGGWSWKLDGCPRLPYRLPELLSADPSQIVFVAEGERKCDRLVKLGLIATCNSGGAGKWLPEHSQHLAGRRVAILPDNDQKGRDHARDVAAKLAGIAADVGIVELPGLAEKGDIVNWLDAGHDLAELMTLVEAARPRKRPEVEVSVERHIVVEEAIAALAADPDVYRRGSMLVTVIRDENEASRDKIAAGSHRILPLDESAVGCALTRNATFYKWKESKEAEPVAVECHPPDWLIKAVAHRKYWSGIRELSSVALCPYVRDDGSIVEHSGYDPETLTLVKLSVDLPAIPARPTKGDAEEAAARLRRVVRQFPLADEDSFAVWLASLITAVQRPMIGGPTPGFAIVGNRAGCGKGLLIDAVGVIAWGTRVPTTDYPIDPVEAQKVKVAIALAGKSIVHFDNLEEGRFYGNRVLDSALTSATIDDRILGTAYNTGTISLRPVWFLSGNNVSPGKDAHRRWLPCRLETDLERPEERDDIEIADLRAHLAARRGELLADVLTILRAHAVAGRPGPGFPPLGSFEEWDRVVRGAVWFATGLDCCGSRRKAADESPERLERLALLEGWRALKDGGEFGRGLTAEQAIRVAEGNEELHGTFLAVLRRLTRDGKTPTARQLGNTIRGISGANIGGLRFVKAGEDHRVAKWRVEPVNLKPPRSGGEGESTSLDESNPIPPRENFRSHTDVMMCGCKDEALKGTGNQTPQTRRLTSAADCTHAVAEEFEEGEL